MAFNEEFHFGGLAYGSVDAEGLNMIRAVNHKHGRGPSRVVGYIEEV
jgi:hypothetical protein